MKTDVRFRPLQTRPPYRDRSRSLFSATWSRTLEDLERELMHLGAEGVVIQIDCDESQIRMDGWPRSDARVNSPAVSVSFECSRGFLNYPCDTYTSWKDNLRAIAKGLEALRAVDRYGISPNGEQYRGWKAITHRDLSFDTSSQAAEHLGYLSGQSPRLILDSRDVYREVIAKLIHDMHPDHGGCETAFQTLLAAKESLERHHRQKLTVA